MMTTNKIGGLSAGRLLIGLAGTVEDAEFREERILNVG
jgi:hypothetical protein